MGLFVRTVGTARARSKIGLANLVYNMQRMIWLFAQPAAARSAKPPERRSSYRHRQSLKPTRCPKAHFWLDQKPEDRQPRRDLFGCFFGCLQEPLVANISPTGPQ